MPKNHEKSREYYPQTMTRMLSLSEALKKGTNSELVGQRVTWLSPRSGILISGTIVKLDSVYPDTAYSVSWRWDENPNYRDWVFENHEHSDYLLAAVASRTVIHYSQLQLQPATTHKTEQLILI